jgi:hypothetical protein
MRRALAACLAAVALGCAAAVAARADNGASVPVHVGNHPGYGRVVFDLPGRPDYTVSQQDQHVLIKFTGNITIGTAPGVPHNVLGLTGGAGQAELVVQAGTAVRAWRQGNLVVVDVLDQGLAASAAPSRTQAPASSAGAAARDPPGAPSARSPAPPPAPAAPTAAPETAVEPAPTPAPPSVPASLEKPAPERSGEARTAYETAPDHARSVDPPAPQAPDVSAPPASPPPAPIVPVTRVADAPGPLGPTRNPVLEVAAEATVGAAAFRRGNTAFVVFDQQLPLDAAALRDNPVFGLATVQQMQNASVLRVHLESDQSLSLSRSAHVWRITAVPGEPQLLPIHPAVTDGRLALGAAAPGRAIGFADPDTGATLLVGTQVQSGQGIVAPRRAVEYLLMPTWQGIAVEPISDAVVLRPAHDGFVLSGGTTGLALSPAPDAANLLAHGEALTRRFDFAALPPEALMQRLHRQIADDAAAPALGRGPGREAAARTMITLGLGVEAQAMLQLAAADDPREAESADYAALTGMAALLAHRTSEAAGLEDDRLSGTDDVALWRAVELAEQHEASPQAAAAFAATLPIVLAYPSPLRDRLLPLVAETLAAGGETAAASALLAERKDDPALGFAWGLLRQAQGDIDGALAAYDALAASKDRSQHARAAARALEVRLAGGRIDAKQAADGMDRLLYAWRGDQYERSLRERTAELRAGTGAWRSALALLREAEAIFPADKAAIHARLVDMFAAMLRHDSAGGLPPLELASLVEENVDLLPTGPAGNPLQARLADRLLALDLPKRADPVLQKLMEGTPSDVGRAEFGARLAELRLREGDASGALAALAASGAEHPPTELAERRTLLEASAHGRRGEREQALAGLDALDTAAADEARATIFERADDWPAAEKALSAYTAKVVPPEGRLDDGQRRSLLRLATAAARAGDATTLAALRQSAGPRMDSGPLGDVFRLLTAEPVRNAGDLKRSGQEAALARELPDELKAVEPAPGVIP